MATSNSARTTNTGRLVAHVVRAQSTLMQTLPACLHAGLIQLLLAEFYMCYAGALRARCLARGHSQAQANRRLLLTVDDETILICK